MLLHCMQSFMLFCFGTDIYKILYSTLSLEKEKKLMLDLNTLSKQNL